MTSEVKYAPKAVVDELDELIGECDELLPFGVIRHLRMKVISLTNESKLSEFVRKNSDNQKAVINHALGNERLQPEREPRYYVEFEDNYGKPGVVFNGARSVDVSFLIRPVAYELGLDRETAVKAQALYGGTIEEIK